MFCSRTHVKVPPSQLRDHPHLRLSPDEQSEEQHVKTYHLRAPLGD